MLIRLDILSDIKKNCPKMLIKITFIIKSIGGKKLKTEPM